MTKRNLARVSMFNAMLLFFGSYAAVINRIPALAAAVDRFRRFLEQCKEAMAEEQLVTEGITDDKAMAQERLCKQTAVITGAASAYAAEKNLGELAGEMKYSARDLGRLGAADLLSTVRRILSQVEPHLLDLVDYGITRELFDRTREAADLFEGKTGTPRQGITIRSDAGERAAELVAQTNAVLRKSIDKLVRQFETTDPEFYSQYWKSRVVVDAATASTDLVVEVAHATAGPIAAAEVRVEGSGVTGTTDAFGRCLLRGVEPGTTRILITHRDYTQKTVEGVQLKPGKKTKLTASLERQG
ncbi:carboxypeptidase-like regulatory domain-containing protein [Flaviaesturariibacter amylovorans]|uniref:Carboxypeptidase regulatory-like domain-containing protein n=1 Tax=Flaviaesturariibacter amylovorans TaxID=1084520 RepID=A0ABP8GBC2_9BACT